MFTYKMVSGRACGPCTACCKTHQITELKKPPAQWCPHVALGKGCGVYPNHPPSCKAFRCEWLKGVGEEFDRPDRTKVVLDFVNVRDGIKGGILQMFEVSEGALDRSQSVETVRQVLRAGIFVSHFYLDGHRRLFVPSPEKLTEEITTGAKEEGFEIVFPLGP